MLTDDFGAEISEELKERGVCQSSIQRKLQPGSE
jgi:hypothetical protein